jgi:HPt (histidine-containing phosphotransfer) domain-containing protein
MTAQNLQLARRMTIPEPAEEAERSLDGLPVLDLVHLSRQTLGDPALEAELLALFQNQARQVAKRLAGPSHPGDQKWRSDLAHTLKGSGRAVGAFRAAQAAENYESAVNARSDRMESALRALCDAVEETRAEISMLLERA